MPESPKYSNPEEESREPWIRASRINSTESSDTRENDLGAWIVLDGAHAEAAVHAHNAQGIEGELDILNQKFRNA